ncbi:DUF2934 domain-containing protein [Mycobacterium sp. KBS0706]|uniref:DUF2934 domain-containing protein n=1 Tax=Mycobacterium sp. KBS0706 TaxID=2578109 RepID=UPI00110F8849|nr:DUF2934 domain-containing protein [Mycobacterium sp. KBS0706]
MKAIARFRRRLARPGARIAGLAASTGSGLVFDQVRRSPRRPVEDEEIRRHAYEIWEREGRPEGRAEEHWRRAEAELHRCRR